MNDDAFQSTLANLKQKNQLQELEAKVRELEGQLKATRAEKELVQKQNRDITQVLEKMGMHQAGESLEKFAKRMLDEHMKLKQDVAELRDARRTHEEDRDRWWRYAEQAFRRAPEESNSHTTAEWIATCADHLLQLEKSRFDVLAGHATDGKVDG